MNEYERVKNMNDSRWNNSLKCDIFKNVAELGELEEHARHTKMAVALQNAKTNLINLKKFKKKYDPVLKEANSHFVGKILTVTNDRRLVKRYSNSHPNEIKSSIRRSIYRINNETNKLVMQIHDTKKKLKKIQNSFCKNFNEKITSNRQKLKQIMGETTEIEKKIALVNFMNRRTEKIVESQKRNLHQYDLIFEQLSSDIVSTSTNLMREIEISDNIKADITNYDREYRMKKRANDKSTRKSISYINKSNAVLDSLEYKRNMLMEGNTMTDMEKEYHSQLPWALDNYDDNFSQVFSEDMSTKVKASVSLDEINIWYKKLLEFGIMHFIDLKESHRLLNDLQNNTNSSAIDYKFPENIAEYIISITNSSNTTDELAVNYLLKTTQFNTAKDLLKSVKNTKKDLIKLNEFNAIRKSFWQLLIKRNLDSIESADYLNLLTNQDAEYSKQIEVLQSFIDNQKIKISDLNETKTYHITLINDLYFYMINLQKVLEQVDYSVNDTKRNSSIKLTSLNKSMETTDTNLMKLIEELKSTIYNIDQKVRRCLLIVDQVDLSPDQLNLAHALYVFQNQEHIQDDIFKTKMKLDNLSKRNVTNEKPKISDDTVLTRLDIKRQADQIVKYFNEKDLDVSKNKRKPISFRKSFI